MSPPHLRRGGRGPGGGGAAGRPGGLLPPFVHPCLLWASPAILLAAPGLRERAGKSERENLLLDGAVAAGARRHSLSVLPAGRLRGPLGSFFSCFGTVSRLRPWPPSSTGLPVLWWAAPPPPRKVPSEMAPPRSLGGTASWRNSPSRPHCALGGSAMPDPTSLPLPAVQAGGSGPSHRAFSGTGDTLQLCIHRHEGHSSPRAP